MSRAISPCDVGGARVRAGFTYVEVTISLGILVVLMGAFVMALEGGSDGFVTGCVKGDLTAVVEHALASIGTDLRQAHASYVRTTTAGLPAGWSAVLIPSARDRDGVFRVNSSYEPVWRSVIVYCPYVNEAGVAQLRRYACFFEAGDYAFPFEFAHVSETQITLIDASSRTLSIDRHLGDTSVESGREFLVLCPGFSSLTVTAGSPACVTVSAAAHTRRGLDLRGEGSRYAYPRN